MSESHGFCNRKMRINAKFLIGWAIRHIAVKSNFMPQTYLTALCYSAADKDTHKQSLDGCRYWKSVFSLLIHIEFLTHTIRSFVSQQKIFAAELPLLQILPE